MKKRYLLCILLAALFMGASPLEDSIDAIYPNEVGDIMVLMYHGVESKKSGLDYQTTVAEFKRDLKDLYERGYRLISLHDLINNNISTKAGYTPVVITFDDAESSAFSFTMENGELVPKEDCAVDILNKFYKEHPDFGRTAVFYINGKGRRAFHGEGTLTECLEYLVNHGYEIGNHTYSHAFLHKLDPQAIQSEMAQLEKFIQEHLPGYKMESMSYPYGSIPSESNLPFVLEGESDGVSYNYKVALKPAAGGPAATPSNILYDVYHIPRVRGTRNSIRDLGWYLDHYDKNPHLRYISDGDPSTISVPTEMLEHLNIKNLDSHELNVYQPQESLEVQR